MLYRSLIILSLLTSIFINDLATDVLDHNESPIENPMEKPMEGDSEQQEESKEEAKIRALSESDLEKNSQNSKRGHMSLVSDDSDGYLKNQTPPPRQA